MPAAESRTQLVQRALREFEGPLIAYAASLLGDLERGRDVVQDTFIRLYEQPEGKVTDGLKSWLYTVCRNRALDVLRRDRRLVEWNDDAARGLSTGEADPSENLASRETQSRIMRFVDRLPANQREVIRLKFHADLSYKEIAEVTGLSVANVGFLLHTGLKRLRGLMSHERSSLS